MKLKLAVAFAVLLFANLAHADQITTGTGQLTIPTGSTVSSINLIPFPYGVEWGNTSLVSYTFSDGTGTTEGNPLLGFWGTIDFTAPVDGLSFSWFGTTIFAANDNAGDSFACFASPVCSGTEAFAGAGITQITWQAGDEEGGITAMSFTVDPPDPPSVPEPSALLLSGMGLAALIALACRNRTNGQKAN
jgi:hypothetical protein